MVATAGRGNAPAGQNPAYRPTRPSHTRPVRDAGAQWVILAGRPVEGIETDDTCAMGLDALDFLTRTREKLQ